MKTTIAPTLAASPLAVLIALLALAVLTTPAVAQIAAGPDINTSQKAGADSECSIAKNPANPLQLFASCNTGSAGLFAVRSTDAGDTWIYPDPADRTIADGDPGQGPAACCDPTIAWDSFGNLYLTYLAALVGGGSPAVETLLSTDGGATFTSLATFTGSMDQPTIVTADVPGGAAVWIVWNQSGTMRASGALATGLGVVGAFSPMQTLPGTFNCSFGDVAIATDGSVVQVCQNPTGGQGPGNLRFSRDPDGIGGANFGALSTATATNVGGFDFIPPQNSRSVDAEAGLAYDRNPMSPTFGRLYLVYTDEVGNESNDTDIRLRWSDNNGTTWSNWVRVNTDPAAPIRSQFLPRIATNAATGNVAICWHDARNSATNTSMEVFCRVGTPAVGGPVFVNDVVVSDGASTSNGFGVEFGDYSGLTYVEGGGPPGFPRFEHPIWGDTSNSTSNNPNGTGNFDAYTNWVRGGFATNEGDPHIRTVDGVRYDFHAGGEFVALKNAGGFEVQIRQTPISTTFFPGPNAHTCLATCVSINSAVAAQVGDDRVTFQPRLDGVPDPSGMEMRINGVLTPLTNTGVNLSQGGRVVRSGVGGMEIEFPNGALLIATPGWWAGQQKWFLNVTIRGGDAFMGIMGAIAPGSWLPYLPDGTDLGPKPSAQNQLYQDLNVTFADAWRVTDQSSLFDYAPGDSTHTFTWLNWPKDNPPCELPEQEPSEPLEMAIAEELCAAVVNKDRREDCVFDVAITGEKEFAANYLRTERVETFGTAIVLWEEERPRPDGQAVVFTARVYARAEGLENRLAGAVQFYLNGERAGGPVKLDESYRARLKTDLKGLEDARISAHFLPEADSPYLASTSQETQYNARR